MLHHSAPILLANTYRVAQIQFDMDLSNLECIWSKIWKPNFTFGHSADKRVELPPHFYLIVIIFVLKFTDDINGPSSYMCMNLAVQY